MGVLSSTQVMKDEPLLRGSLRERRPALPC
jgi:hypothetical protein